MKAHDSAREGASSWLAAVAVIVLLVVAAGSYWMYAFSGSGRTTTTNTIYYYTPSTIGNSTSTSAPRPFVLPPGGTEIVIPPGIHDPDAQQLGITFTPVHVNVVVGVNNTLYFVNTDVNFTLGHVIESTQWPKTAQPFAFEILPGQVMNVTLSTPGVYNYTCVWHPVWMHGSITVVGQ